MERFVKVAIIGGGLSGLMAARTLKDNGLDDVLMIEKARSVGGRLATRRLENGRVDHGTQFFTVRTQSFQTIVDQWLAAGWVRKWFGDKHPRYLSENGMNALAKHLAEGTDALLNTRVTELKKDHQYILNTENGQVVRAEAVIVTAPTPQAIDLVKQVATKEQLEKLEIVQFDPCLVAIFELGEGSHFSNNGHLDQALPADVLRIVDHEKKGISPTATVSVYMKGAWSAEHYEQADDNVLKAIEAKVTELLPLQSLHSAQLKRWRYAQARTFIQQTKPFIEMAAGLYVAGDAFLRADDLAGKVRMESAALSGVAVAQALLKKRGDEMSPFSYTIKL